LAHHLDDNDNNNDNNDSLEDDDANQEENALNRRNFFHQVQSSLASLIIATATTITSTVNDPNAAAHAVGLVFFPCTTPLHNEYHMMRAGTTLLEEDDIWSTNPMFLTNREAALSDQGIAQVQAACQLLIDANINPSVMKYSLAASAMDTVGLVRDELKVGQNRVVPEFTFMDPRAIGKWDMMSYSQTRPAVMAMDEAEAGRDGTGGRPPPNDDGTPHETLADQAIRLRQLMSSECIILLVERYHCCSDDW
jgi:broad specificity phosphatase PhoE